MYKDVVIIKGNRRLTTLSVENRFYNDIKEVVLANNLSLQMIESHTPEVDLVNLKDRIAKGVVFILFSRGDKYIMELYKAKAKPEQIIVIGGRSKFATDPDVGLYLRNPDDETMYGNLSMDSIYKHFEFSGLMKQRLSKYLKEAR